MSPRPPILGGEAKIFFLDTLFRRISEIHVGVSHQASQRLATPPDGASVAEDGKQLH
jgi:hypothetical protein